MLVEVGVLVRHAPPKALVHGGRYMV
jgi:hypothetical protein